MYYEVGLYEVLIHSQLINYTLLWAELAHFSHLEKANLPKNQCLLYCMLYLEYFYQFTLSSDFIFFYSINRRTGFTCHTTSYRSSVWFRNLHACVSPGSAVSPVGMYQLRTRTSYNPSSKYGTIPLNPKFLLK